MAGTRKGGVEQLRTECAGSTEQPYFPASSVVLLHFITREVNGVEYGGASAMLQLIIVR